MRWFLLLMLLAGCGSRVPQYTAAQPAVPSQNGNFTLRQVDQLTQGVRILELTDHRSGKRWLLYAESNGTLLVLP